MERQEAAKESQMRFLSFSEQHAVSGGDDAAICESAGDIVGTVAAAVALGATSSAGPIAQAGATATAYNVGNYVGEESCEAIADWSEVAYTDFMRSIDIMAPQVFMATPGSWL